MKVCHNCPVPLYNLRDQNTMKLKYFIDLILIEAAFEIDYPDYLFKRNTIYSFSMRNMWQSWSVSTKEIFQHFETVTCIRSTRWRWLSEVVSIEFVCLTLVGYFSSSIIGKMEISVPIQVFPFLFIHTFVMSTSHFSISLERFWLVLYS